jgi:hypothetical protein
MRQARQAVAFDRLILSIAGRAVPRGCQARPHALPTTASPLSYRILAFQRPDQILDQVATDDGNP